MIRIRDDRPQVQRGDFNSEDLTGRELGIVRALIEAPHHRMTREEIERTVWGRRVSSKAIDVHMVGIRRKLEDLGAGVDFRPRTGQFVLISDLSWEGGES